METGSFFGKLSEFISVALSLFSLRVTTSIYPVPSICAQDQISDWFDSLAECLHWNVRKRQKCLGKQSSLFHRPDLSIQFSLCRRIKRLDWKWK